MHMVGPGNRTIGANAELAGLHILLRSSIEVAVVSGLPVSKLPVVCLEIPFALKYFLGRMTNFHHRNRWFRPSALGDNVWAETCATTQRCFLLPQNACFAVGRGSFQICRGSPRRWLEGLVPGWSRI